MPYTKTSWTSGTTPVDAPEMNNEETQYTEATLSLNPDMGIGVVLTGMTGVRDGSNLAKLDFTGGTAYVKQLDGTFRERILASDSSGLYVVSVPSTTYYFDLNPDGTVSFATTHSAVTNHITIMSMTTDSSTHINVITDARPRTLNLFPGMDAGVTPQIGGDVLAQMKSNGGGAAGQNIWIGTTDPGSNAQEGDLWFNF
jgi:hypothetical protein